ncbi:MAG: Mu transposase C-terminal domain-containing protein, partial [Flammeovirgaceae bacterium]
MIQFKPGEQVFHKGRKCQIRKTKGLDEVWVVDQETFEPFIAKVVELTDKTPDKAQERDPGELPFEGHSPKQQEKAKWRFTIIKPFLNEMKGDKAAMVKTASANSLNVSTLYKWIDKFKQYGHVGALVDSDKKGGKDHGRLDEAVEKQIASAIENVYFESKEISKTYKYLVDSLTDLGLKVPSEVTLRRRINRISKRERVERRQGPRTAAQVWDPKTGTIPYVDTPLDLVQIDHTMLDIMLVDEERREFTQRPWITLLIDVFSRVILGFYISYDPPGSFAVGRAVIHALLRKEKYLESLGLSDVHWPCWGKMGALHADNAKDLRGEMLKECTAEYKITMKWRPVGKPEFGGYIERLMGTITSQLKNLSGYTGVGKELRSKFRPEKSAALTISDFEKWFTVWVTKEYHNKPHKGLSGATPLQRWADGIEGKNGCLGIGLPALITDEDKLHYDWLPLVKRTVQRTGVHWETLRYYSGVLSKWINAEDETSKGPKKQKREFIFRIDPRDISSIYFLDPSDKHYHQIPCTMNFKPDIVSIWDLHRSVLELKKSKTPITDRNIIDTHRRLRGIEEESSKKTKQQQRKNERERRMSKEGKRNIKTSNAQTLPPTLNNLKTQIEIYEEFEYTT